jgi:heptosyltransferase-2
MGDVLRTTCLLPLIAGEHPRASISWVTRPESTPLLENNPYLANVVTYGPDALAHLLSRSFDRVINLDAGRVSAELATIARGWRKDGFVLDGAGRVVATNEAARGWLSMGLFDDLKRDNTQTYQSLMAGILGLPDEGHRYVFRLSESERSRAREHLLNLGVDLGAPVVGVNPGAGGRWELKKWREQGFVSLIDWLHEDLGVQVLLLGGRAEEPGIERLKERVSVPVFDAGCDNEVRHFAALMGHCGVIVLGDTLAMHLGLALGRRVVVLFGPTSAAEIELYGLGEKVVPEMECLACYKATCDFIPNCMDLISFEMVAGAVRRQLELAGCAQGCER